MKLEIVDSVLCDRCSNAGPGVIIPGERICYDCIDDAEIVVEIIRQRHPELLRIEKAIKASGLFK